MKKTLLFVLFLLAGRCLSAQGDDLPNDIRPDLKTLSPEQKAQVLDYLRRLNAPDIDRQIQTSYSQLQAADRTKAVRYVELLKKEDGRRSVRTSVRWSRDTIHFGNIEEGRVFMDSVLVTNTGNMPYVISGSRTSCDCTVLQRPDFPVMPGEKAAVRIGFDSRNKLGPVSAVVVIYDNSAPNIRSMLYLSGEVTPRKPKE